jgi:hypothetical protein
LIPQIHAPVYYPDYSVSQCTCKRLFPHRRFETT